MIQFLTPSPLLALALLFAWTAWAWRQPRTSRLARFRHGLAAITFWSWLWCTPAVTNMLMVALEGPLPMAGAQAALSRAPDTSIIVLGSGEMWTPGGLSAPRLDENGWERLHEGVRLWRNTDGTLIFTGGPGGADEPTLAGQMGLVAREMGVPPARMALAVRSRTTYEDLVAAKALVRGEGPVWLVTSAIHMPRALAVARRLGIHARPFPVDYRQIRRPTWRAWIPDGASIDRMDAVLHEFVGRLWYRWQGRAD